MGLREYIKKAYRRVIRILHQYHDQRRKDSPNSNDSQVETDRPAVIREVKTELHGQMQKISIPWLEIADKELGISEIPGSNHNQRILEYHNTTTLAAIQDEVPWCASFVNWVLMECGIKGTGSAAARSFLNWGYPCDDFTKGSIVILKRGSKAWQGHVGFAVDHNILAVKVLGGNQGNAVSYKWYLKSDVLGYRWPKDKA